MYKVQECVFFLNDTAFRFTGGDGQSCGLMLLLTSWTPQSPWRHFNNKAKVFTKTILWFSHLWRTSLVSWAWQPACSR